jgi:hypothetical protein
VLKIKKSLAGQEDDDGHRPHEMQFARDVSDKVLFMDGGVIVRIWRSGTGLRLAERRAHAPVPLKDTQTNRKSGARSGAPLFLLPPERGFFNYTSRFLRHNNCKAPRRVLFLFWMWFSASRTAAS